MNEMMSGAPRLRTSVYYACLQAERTLLSANAVPGPRDFDENFVSMVSWNNIAKRAVEKKETKLIA